MALKPKEKTAVLKSYGERCRKARLSQCMSLTEFGYLTGYAASSISKFEQGKSDSLYLYQWYCEIFKGGEMI